LFVPKSFADTCRMPFASRSKVTSICGTPRGAGGMSDSYLYAEAETGIITMGHIYVRPGSILLMAVAAGWL
jgi:hypothetical protein